MHPNVLQDVVVEPLPGVVAGVPLHHHEEPLEDPHREESLSFPHREGSTSFPHEESTAI